jgi:hypothetical protein
MILPLESRKARYSEHAAEAPLALVRIERPGYDTLLLASDWVELLSDDPVYAGVRSTWQGTDTPATEAQDYVFVLMQASLPDKSEGTIPAVTLTFENVDYDMATEFRTMRNATVALASVLGSAPDDVEEEYRGLKVVPGGSVTDDRVTLVVSRQPTVSEPCPAHRMTPSRFPALFR